MQERRRCPSEGFGSDPANVSVKFRAVFINQVGLCLIVGSAGVCGIVMLAYYNDCDPLKSGRVASSDLVTPNAPKQMLLS